MSTRHRLDAFEQCETLAAKIAGQENDRRYGKYFQEHLHKPDTCSEREQTLNQLAQ